MPNITIYSDKRNHRSAKIYAARRGLSLSQSFRDRIRAVCGHGETRGSNRSSVEAIALSGTKRYARVELKASEAMAGLNFSGVGQLSNAAVQAGMALSRPSKPAGLHFAKPLSARRKLVAQASPHAGHHGRRSADQLAPADRPDLLLCLDLDVCIPDAVYLEAAEKYARHCQGPPEGLSRSE